MTKNFHMSSSGARAIGHLLIFISFFIISFASLIFFIGDNLTVAETIPSIIMILFSFPLSASGIIYLKNRKKIIRVKIDDEGIYFKGTRNQSDVLTAAFFLKKFTFIPFKKMSSVNIKPHPFLPTIWIKVRLKDRSEKNINTKYLSKEAIEEIYEMMKKKIK